MALDGPSTGAWRKLMARPDRLNTVRRHAEEALDQAVTPTLHRIRPSALPPLLDDDPRLAVVTVNYSTTRFLKLMLCTLGEQSELWFVQHLVIVDNGSRDGGLPFLRTLASRLPRLHLVERRHFLNHAAGMRAGVHALEQIDGDEPSGQRANLLLFVDPDVIFLNAATLLDLSATIVNGGAAFAGEARLAPPAAHPDVQASFFAVRRDVLARRDIRPLVNHGSPAYGLQASILKARLRIADFPSNHGRYILHRGRAAVAAATEFGVGPYHGVANRQPHYMGVPDGAAVWAGAEQEWGALLEAAAEPDLLAHLEARFSVLGSPSAPG